MDSFSEEAFRYQLNSVQGWIELRNFSEAHCELDRLPREFLTRDETYFTRCMILMLSGSWKNLATFARGLTDVQSNPDYYAFWAIAEHKLGNTAWALDIVRPFASTATTPQYGYIVADLNEAIGAIKTACDCREWAKQKHIEQYPIQMSEEYIRRVSLAT
jgi:hypothetical protein